ncbi:MAG: hypothetical protein KJP00_01845 [Bacteroidia bacterium]|nr:hypothetical protein [Bacteroidia bacterium]
MGSIIVNDFGKVYWLLALLIISGCYDQNNLETDKSLRRDENVIRQIHSDYVKGWLENDEEKIMGLFEENSMIQPNKLNPIEGKENIRSFWFPKDNSITTINDFKTEIISFNMLDSLAVTTHTSILDWSYQKDSTAFGMIQRGINTTVYRRQNDRSWKIWRSMWTDIERVPN